MGKQNNNLNTQPVETVMEIKPRRVWWKYAVGVLLIVVFIVAGYIAWYQYFSSEAKYRREVEKSALALPAKLEAYKKAMEADVYGGKTPEETLQMFIDALKKGDIDLAFKYFILKDNLQRDDSWLEAMMKVKDEGKISEIVDSLEKAKPNPDENIHDGDFRFSTGDDYSDVNMEFNKHSGVWKIESL